MNLMPHPRGGFNKSNNSKTTQEVYKSLKEVLSEVWVDEMPDTVWVPLRTYDVMAPWVNVRRELKAWRKKKGIRRP